MTPSNRQTLLEALDTALCGPYLGLQKAATLEEFCEGKTGDPKTSKGRKKTAPAKPEAPQPRYVLRPDLRIRVAHHFDIAPAALVYDPELGTLGVVEIFDPTRRDAAADSDDPSLDPAAHALREVKAMIDGAVYLRHLLWTDAERHNARIARDDLPGRGVIPLTVELVIACQAPEEDQSGSAALSDALGEVSRETAYLQAVGVNVLYHFGNRDFELAHLRRAFPWLLRSTREWFRKKSNAKPPSPAVANGAGVLEQITLTDYRLQGKRTFKRSPSSRLHLLHGHNGTGKSSLVESLELVMTGRIERLDNAGEPDYYKVIRHRSGQIPEAEKAASGNGAAPAGSEVRIEVNRAGQPMAVVIEITPASGVGPNPLRLENFRAMSFRLDQQVMDRVVRASDVHRAALLGESLLPELRNELQGFSGARDRAEQSFRRLPIKIRNELSSNPEDREKQLLERFGWLVESGPADTKIPFDQLKLALPLAEETLQTLGTVSPGIRDLLSRWKTKPIIQRDIEHELRTLEDYLHSALGSPTITEAFDTAHAVLEALKDWQGVRGRQESRDFPTALNRWLESIALADLANRHHAVAACFAGLAEGTWRWPEHVTPFPGVAELSREQLAGLKAQQVELTRTCEQQRSEVAGWQQPGQRKMAREAQSRPGPPPRGPLSRSEIEHLNLAGPYLTALQGTGTQRGLGDAVQQALTSHHEEEIGKLAIGRRGGASAALAELQALAAAYQQAKALSQEEAGWSGLYTRYIDAYRAFTDSRATGARLEQAFQQILAGEGEGSLPGLTAALNELLALFKPARWAYNDIALTPTSDGPGTQSGIGGLGGIGRPPGLTSATAGLGLRTADGHRAELRLNTAELNSLTLALFLLTAVRTANPLQVLVLDDPLQNMDELTVTALARGLGKLFRGSVFPEGWQLLALFHGEDDLERVRRETTCAVYQFPWLRPAARPEESTLVFIEENPERSNLVSKPQGIAGLFAPQS